MRTRRLHARFAYVMRVENRASVAYAAASTSARTPRPPRVAYAEASCRPGLRGKKRRCGRAAHRTLGLRYALFARHAGSHDAHKATARTLMRTLVGKVFGACPHPATITYNAKASELAARQHALRSLLTRWIATRDTKELQPTARASLVRCICPAHRNSVAAPCIVK
jgi:hypothetical protein